MAVTMIEAELPDFGVPETRPVLAPELYAARYARFMERLRDAGLAAAVVYADREHFANLAWLTAFDPRFEEALCIAIPGRRPLILTGPENQGTAAAALIEVDVALYPPFGLLGQDRTKTPPLADLLSAAGIKAGMAIGTLGWKYFGRHEAAEPDGWLEIPSFIADTLRALAGPSGRVVNATALMMDASTGLRAVNEVDQIAGYEFAASHVSEAVKRVLFGVKPGMREYEAARLLQQGGSPLSCHTMLSAGPRAFLGLGSPADRAIERGDPMTCAFGTWGALTARGGFVVADGSELPPGIADYADRLVGPYFRCAAEWYETIGIGVTGGEIDAMVKRRLGDDFFRIALNPGHLIQLDEWLNTPVYPGSRERFQSGQAVQLDIIPATGTDYFTTNIEDGIALLDERGRAELRERHAGAWARIEARRGFMADVLGIRPKPEVLPLSNLAGYLPPFWLAPRRVFARRD